jgi:single-strand DNA-binding protein
MKVLNNSVQLIGHLGKDVEVKVFESGSKMARISLATTDMYKNQNGEQVSQTQWHTLVAWGKTAELMANSLTKGSQVAINGALNYRTYTDRDGQRRTIAEINVNDFLTVRQSA